jgi:hypothetical protein
MGLFSWIEKKVFLKNVTAEYGEITAYKRGLTSFTVSAYGGTLMNQKGLIIKQSALAFLGGSVSYIVIPKEHLSKLRDAIDQELRRN